MYSKITLRNTLLITNNFPPIIDGVGDYTYNLMKNLSSYEKVYVICKDSNIIKDFIRNDNIETYVYPIIRKWNFYIIIKIICFSKKNNIDRIIVQYAPTSFNKLWDPFFMVILAILFRINRLKCSFYFHEVAVRVFGHGYKRFLLGSFQRIVAYLICLFGDAIITNSIFAKNLLKPFKSVYFPIPSNFNIQRKFQLNNSISNKIIIISFLNRCNSELLEVISILRETKFSNLNLYLIGKASQNQKKIIENKIYFLDLDNIVNIIYDSDANTLSNYLSTATIYIQLEMVNGYNEGGISTKSGAIMSAMFAGLPIITTKGDMTDLNFFINKENLLFVNGLSKKDIISSIIYLIENPEISIKLGNNAYSTYLKLATWEIHAKNIHETLY